MPVRSEGRDVRTHPAPGAWLEATWDAARHLDQPPRQLATLAVVEFGPRAAAWALWLRDTYRDAPADGIARLATRQARRHGMLLAASEAAGPVAVLQPPVMAAVRVLLVLKVAAAYGHDPSDPARVDDLITLLEMDHDPARSRLVRGLGIAFGTVGRLRRRRTPTAALWAIVSAGERADSLERLAYRAARHFRQ